MLMFMSTPRNELRRAATGVCGGQPRAVLLISRAQIRHGAWHRRLVTQYCNCYSRMIRFSRDSALCGTLCWDQATMDKETADLPLQKQR